MINKIIYGLLIFFTLNSLAYANEDNEKLVVDFSKKQLIKSKIPFENLKVFDSKELDGDWEAITISFDVSENGDTKNVKEILLVNGDYIVSDAINLKDMSTLREQIQNEQNALAPKLSAQDYNYFTFVAGNKDAKNKLVVFSDPFCPFCKDEFSKIIKKVKNSENVAFYMAQIPLNIHPASAMVIKHIYASNNIPAAIEKVYNAKVKNTFIASTDFDEINTWFNKITGEHVTKKDIENQNITKRMEDVEKIADKTAISSTPTIYINNKRISDRKKVSEIF